jgi:hypothetical protein
MVEVIACIKGFAALLLQSSPWLTALLHQAVCLQMQQLLQSVLVQLKPAKHQKASSYTRVLYQLPTSCILCKDSLLCDTRCRSLQRTDQTWVSIRLTWLHELVAIGGLNS